MGRYQIKKLIKGKSTKAERKFAELLKGLHIPFRTKVLIGNREVDFIIGRYVIEIDGQDQQDCSKNIMLVNEGYIPIHLNNWHINGHLVDWLKQICLLTKQDIQRRDLQAQPLRLRLGQ